MFELTGTINGLTTDFRTKNALLTLSINEKQSAMDLFDELNQANKLKITIDIYREKRSLNSNNYAWKLMTEIGNVLRANKEDIYFKMLKRYGQRTMISVQSHIPIQEFVKYCEEAGESTLKGKEFKHYFVYKGSSEFDSREMSIFLDGIIDEAKALGIQTETPEMIAKLKSLWGEANE